MEKLVLTFTMWVCYIAAQENIIQETTDESLSMTLSSKFGKISQKIKIHEVISNKFSTFSVTYFINCNEIN